MPVCADLFLPSEVRCFVGLSDFYDRVLASLGA
jgi:hypothetical protein